MKNKIKTLVFDAGGRYGLHPSWKPFTGELEYYLFEPDPAEADRLKLKYKQRAHEVKIVDQAVAEKPGKMTINFFRNRAMSSSVARNPISALFKGERESEVEIVESLEVNSDSVDNVCETKGVSIDFLKLDTEGTEYSILRGAENQLRENILGIRCEVSFEKVFEGMPLFGDIHKFLIDRGFYLLNLDYDGRGENQNDCVAIPGRYGILVGCDAVWMKRQSAVFEKNTTNSHQNEKEIDVLKYVSFCLMNNASDVAIDLLLKARGQYNMKFDGLTDTRLHKFVDLNVQKLFYSLKWQPGQSLKKNQDIYFEIFGQKMKEMNEFMESMELNPT